MATLPSISYAIAGALLIPPILIACVVSPLGKEWYDRTVLPYVIDIACTRSAFMDPRHKVVPLARGRVLEIGIGSGINLPLYSDKVTQIVGVDPSAAIQDLAGPRIATLLHQHGTPVEMIPLELGQIDAPDNSFDDIVCTFTLCTIPDGPAALREMRRVLKPGGRLFFAEHGKAPEADKRVRQWQTRLNPFWSPLVGGCRLDRDIPALIREGGFEIQKLDAGYINMPSWLGYVFTGWAD